MSRWEWRPRSHPCCGKTVKAVVVLRSEWRGKLSEAEIIDWCHAHMAVYTAPRVVEFADALPKRRAAPAR